jgi:hypothetical protein
LRHSGFAPRRGFAHTRWPVKSHRLTPGGNVAKRRRLCENTAIFLRLAVQSEILRDFLASERTEGSKKRTK